MRTRFGVLIMCLIDGQRGLDGALEVRGCHAEAPKLGIIHAFQSTSQDGALDQLCLVHEVDPGLGEPDKHDPTVIGHAHPLYQVALLHPVDDPGGARERCPDDLGQAAHGHGIVVAQQRQDVKVGHADAQVHEPPGTGAAERAEGTAEAGHGVIGSLEVVERRPGNALDGVSSVPGGLGVDRDGRSHRMEYLRPAKYPVKCNSQPTMEDPRMRFALMIEPQMGLTYDEQLAIARRAEAAGFETFFRSDHYQSFPGDPGAPTTDAWTVVAGLARDTETINLGVLVSPVTFRMPGNLAKVIVTADEMSGGRVEFGVGAGWHEEEHRRHGFPFPAIGERADRLEETLEVLHGLWEEPDGWSFHGQYNVIEDALFRPRPADLPARKGGRPRIIVGGGGSPRSFRIAARFADEFNLSSASPELAVTKYQALDDVLRAAGREPATLAKSAMAGILVGRDAAEVRRREGDLLALFGAESDGDDWLAERRPRWICGTHQEAREQVRRFEAAGAERLMLQDFLPRDLDMIDLMAEALFS